MNPQTTIGVYVLQSLKNGRYYIGSTDDIVRRFQEHVRGKVSATRYIRPLELRIFIPCDSLPEARRAEYRLKKYKRREVVEKVISSGVFPWESKTKGP